MSILASLLFYSVITLIIFIFDSIKFKRIWYDPLNLYLFFMSLYVLPLGIRYIFNIDISGNVTYMFYDIKYIFPYAVILVALSNLAFYFAYLFIPSKWLVIKIEKLTLKLDGNSTVLLYAALFLFLIGGSLLAKFILQSGGFVLFILKGYAITEILSENPLLATSIPMLFVSSFLFMASSIRMERKRYYYIGICLFVTLILLNTILGRRAVIAAWGLVFLIFYSELFKQISFKKIMPLLFLGFICLNILGLVRNSNYENFDGLVDSVSERTQRDGINDKWYYTIIDGQFAVPFESLPVYMNSEPELYYGTTPIINIFQWVPRFLWPDKPYGLAREYYVNYYDSSSSANIGRQFFILTEGFLNFGIIGVLVWAFLLGIFFRFISNILFQNKKKIVSDGTSRSSILVFIGAIYSAFIIQIVASDSTILFVTIVKQTILWYVLPVFLFWILRRIRI